MSRIERPEVRVPVVATDENYPAGTEAWSATATKIDPGTGAEADGHVPETRPPAQHFNFYQNAWGRWLQHLRDIGVRNYIDITTEFASYSLFSICYLPTSYAWVFGQDLNSPNNRILRTYTNAFQFFEAVETTAAGGQNAPIYYLTSNNDDLALGFAATTAVTDPDVWSYVGSTDTFSRVVLAPFASDFDMEGSIHAHTADRWLVVGREGTTPDDLVCYYSDNDGSTWTGPVTLQTTIDATSIDSIAIDQDTPLIMVVNSLSTATDVFTSATGAAASWTKYNDVTVGATKIENVTHVEFGNGIFMMLGNLNGSTEIKPFISTDGSSWAAGGVIYDNPQAVGGLAVSGGTWLALIHTTASPTDRNVVYMSQDDGDNWEPVCYLEEPPLGYKYAMHHDNGRWIIVLKSAGVAYVYASFSV
jgi:hypothetical protein